MPPPPRHRERARRFWPAAGAAMGAAWKEGPIASLSPDQRPEFYAVNGRRASGKDRRQRIGCQTRVRPRHLRARRVGAPSGRWRALVRRARESAGAPPLAPPPLPRAQAPARRVEVAPPQGRAAITPAPGGDVHRLRPESSHDRVAPDRWLHRHRRHACRPRRRGRHCVARVVERRLGSVVLDGRRLGSGDHRCPPSRRRHTLAAAGHRRTRRPTDLSSDHHHDRGRLSGRAARDLLLDSRQRFSRAERDGVRRQLLERDRSDRGDLQRSGGADQLPRPEHLHGHRAAVERALGSGGDHHSWRRVRMRRPSPTAERAAAIR